MTFLWRVFFRNNKVCISYAFVTVWYIFFLSLFLGRSGNPIAESFRKGVPYSATDKKKQELDQKIAEMICVDLLPYSAVEKEGFRRVLKAADSRYTIPSEKFFRTTVIPDMADRVRGKVLDLLDAQKKKDMKKFSFTTDIWSSRANDSYISLTCHFVDSEKFERQNLMLNVSLFNENHNADNIAAKVQQMIQVWGLSEEDFFMIMRDNAVNMKAAFSRVGMNSFGCLAHSLQLVVKDGCLGLANVMNLLSVARKMVSYFHHSAQATQRLKEIQRRLNVPELKLIQDVPTRWNYSLDMLERMLILKPAILQYDSEWPLSSVPTSAQWKLSVKVIDVLGIFKSATLKISQQNSLLSEILPTVKSLLRSIPEACDGDDAGVKAMKAALVQSLRSRFEEHFQNESLILATVVDPRFKASGLMDVEMRERTKFLLKEKVKKIMMETTRDDAAPALKRRRSGSDLSPSKKKSLWANLSDSEDEMPENPSTIQEAPDHEPIPEAKIDAAVELFWSIPREPEVDPFEYWKSHHLEFREVAVIAEETMSCPSGSVDSERLFSTAGNVVNPRRVNLTPVNAEDQIFLSKNLIFLNFDW